MKKGSKIIALLMVLALAGSLLAGCGNSGGNKEKVNAGKQTDEPAKKEEEEKGEKEETKDGKDADSLPRDETLYFAGQQWGTVNDYNPLSANSNNAMAISQSDMSRTIVYETLYMWNPLTAEMTPLLAQGDPEWDEGKTQITVKLNPDAKWSDGTPVTAEDVAYTFTFHTKYESPTGEDMLSYIDAIEAKDDSTVVFKAKKGEDGKALNPLLTESFLPKLYILQKAYMEKVEKRCNEDSEAVKTDRMDDLIASGPYKPYMDNEQKVVFIRDDNYWGQAGSMWGKLPVPKYLAHTIYKDNSAALTAIQKGEVDVSQTFIPDVQKLWLEQDLPISTYMDEAPYSVCLVMPTLFFNTGKPGLDQTPIRKAIAMAVDYDQIISSAMSGQSPTFEDVPRSVMNPTDADQEMVDQDALAKYQWKNADVEGAKKLLDEAGIVDSDGDGIREYKGQKLSYKAECPSGWSDWNASLEIVAAAGKEIGINIETYFPEASQYYDDYTTGNFDITMQSSSGSSVANPYQRCMFFLSSTYNDLDVNYSGNFGHFKNDRADEILKLIPNESDNAKLKGYYTELSQIMLEECPCVPLMYRPQLFHVVNESVWTGYPQMDDGTNIPPTDCTDGYGIAALYHLTLVDGQ
ncbi:ABC transporter substrate-binding protein [Eubacteriales bacterium mix99]